MSIRIEIGERYVVTSDSFSLFSTRKRERKAVKTPVRMAGGGWLLSEIKPARFRPDAHDILTGSAKSFADLNAQVEHSAGVVQRLLAHMAVKASGRLSLRQHLPQAPVRRLPVLMHERATRGCRARKTPYT